MLCVNEKRMERKKNCLILNNGRFFISNSYFRSVCGTFFVFREIIFCCMWRHFIFNAFLFFPPNSKHCNTIREGFDGTFCLCVHIIQPSVINNCFYFSFYKDHTLHTRVAEIASFLRFRKVSVPEYNLQTGTMCYLQTASSPCVRATSNKNVYL